MPCQRTCPLSLDSAFKAEKKKVERLNHDERTQFSRTR